MNSTWEDLYQHQQSSPSAADSCTLLTKCRKVCDEASKVILSNLGSSVAPRNGRKNDGDGGSNVLGSKSNKNDSALGHSYSRKREVKKEPSLAPAVVILKSHRSPLEKATEAFEAERQLWMQLKKFKDTNDRNVISFINGFYITLLASIELARDCGHSQEGASSAIGSGSFKSSEAMTTSDQRSDPSKMIEARKMESDLLYNLYIRVGDLNRYLKNHVLAKSYYNQARTSNPRRGHAYNQLALISPNRLLQVYYYVRAVCSSEDPISFAAENLKSQVTKFAAVGEQANIVALFIPAPSGPGPRPPPGFSNQANGHSESTYNGLNPIPIDASNVSNWVYMVIIAIYSNNLAVVLEPLFEQSKRWIHEQLSGEDPFLSSGSKFNDYNLTKDSTALLPALDVLFDYVLCLTLYQNDDDQDSNKSEKQKMDLEKRKFHVVSALQYHQHRLLTNLKMSITSLLAMSDNFALGVNTSALKHDYALLGFSHLSSAHSKLMFEEGSIPQFRSNEFILLVKRINDKIRLVEGIINNSTQTRTNGTNSWPAYGLPVESVTVIQPSVSPSPVNKPRKSRNAMIFSLQGSGT